MVDEDPADRVADLSGLTVFAGRGDQVCLSLDLDTGLRPDRLIRTGNKGPIDQDWCEAEPPDEDRGCHR